MEANDLGRLLARLGACAKAVAWAKPYTTLDEAWAACPRGDWMLWLAGKMAGRPGCESRKPLVRAACECARLGLETFEAKYPGDMRPRRAIEAAEAWAGGRAGLGEVLSAVREARAACEAACESADASRAAYAAAYAANEVDGAYVAAYAADAAAFAAYAAAYAAAGAAASAAHSQCADIVRKHYPQPPEGASLESAITRDGV